jgi:hypothetical protein
LIAGIVGWRCSTLTAINSVARVAHTHTIMSHNTNHGAEMRAVFMQNMMALITINSIYLYFLDFHFFYGMLRFIEMVVLRQ